MTRKTGQFIALGLVVALTIALIAYQFFYEGSLKSSVLDPYGYGDGYGDEDEIELGEYLPHVTDIVDGLPRKKYYVGFGELITLDGLLMPIQVPSLGTPVKWTQRDTDKVQMPIDDDSVARTYFMAPNVDIELAFLLESDVGGLRKRVANYVFVIMSPLAMRADYNNDRLYDLKDLTDLLQRWNEYGIDSLRVLAVILSNYNDSY